jgi:asparagine synthase (glutamine-hydrolysing)
MLAPLLSDDLISYAPHINNKYKYDERNKIGKLLLRKLLAKYKADSLISKEKLGFNVNTINLWKSYGYELCKHFLDNPRIVRDHWINKDWIIKHIDNQELDIRYVNKFLGILSFEIWYRLFVTKEMKSHEKL